MGKIRQILADNMRIYRRKQGLTQEKLAEKAGISAHYLAMVEVSRKFPKPEMLERLAEALEVEPHELFTVAPTPQDELEKIRQEVKNDIENSLGEKLEQSIADAIEKALSAQQKGKE